MKRFFFSFSDNPSFVQKIFRSSYTYGLTTGAIIAFLLFYDNRKDNNELITPQQPKEEELSEKGEEGLKGLVKELSKERVISDFVTKGKYNLDGKRDNIQVGILSKTNKIRKVMINYFKFFNFPAEYVNFFDVNASTEFLKKSSIIYIFIDIDQEKKADFEQILQKGIAIEELCQWVKKNDSKESLKTDRSLMYLIPGYYTDEPEGLSDVRVFLKTKLKFSSVELDTFNIATKIPNLDNLEIPPQDMKDIIGVDFFKGFENKIL